jgi:two-component system, NarL family, response regulator NreC
MELARIETENTEAASMDNVRILLADDHNILRDGMRLLLERQPGFSVVGEAADGREIVEMAREHHPDVIVMDIAMPNMNGIEATRRIVEKRPETGVVILSMHYDESYVLRSLKAGARAYLLKDALKAELISAIRAVAEGRSFFSPKVSRVLQEDYVKALNRKDSDDTYELLTDREREILQLVAEGKTNKEIASLLTVSLYTVDTHRTHILQKLNLHSVPELILYAVRKGIIS